MGIPQCLRSETQPAADGCATADCARCNGWHEPLARHGHRSRHRTADDHPDHRHRGHRRPLVRRRRRRRAARGARGAVAGGAGRGPPYPRGDRGAGRRRGAALRRLHRLRRPRHPAHPHRAAGPAAAQPRAQPRRRLRRRGRARGRPRPDAAAPVDPGHRPHRRAGGGRDDVRRAAERGPDPGRARVRQPRLLRRPRAAGALRAGADGRGPGARRLRRRCSTRPTRSPRTASPRSCCARRRAWR